MCLAKRDGTGPDVSSKFLSSCPKGLVWWTFFFPSGFPEISHFLHPVRFLFFFFFWRGGYGVDVVRVCAHIPECVVYVFPRHTPLCTLFLWHLLLGNFV